MVLNVSILSIMSMVRMMASGWWVDSTAVSIFVDIFVDLTNTNTVFVDLTNVSTNIEAAAEKLRGISLVHFKVMTLWSRSPE